MRIFTREEAIAEPVYPATDSSSSTRFCERGLLDEPQKVSEITGIGHDTTLNANAAAEGVTSLWRAFRKGGVVLRREGYEDEPSCAGQL